MSIRSSALLNDVLVAARGKGLDQGALARAARVAPETISRAKTRGNIELKTLTALAEAAGVELRVQAVAAPPGAGGGRQQQRASLADPRWGIAWSNPDMDAGALITNALLKGAYGAILEAAAAYGIDRVRGRWGQVKGARPARMSKQARASVERILGNIAKGFARAET